MVDTEPAVSDQIVKIRQMNNSSYSNIELQVTDLSFTYPNQSTPALQNVTFDLQPSTSIAIVGPSGAGKSTLANLLLRFWDYEVGEITLSGESLKALNQDEVRARDRSRLAEHLFLQHIHF